LSHFSVTEQPFSLKGKDLRKEKSLACQSLQSSLHLRMPYLC
jgi:hypothetical protein